MTETRHELGAFVPDWQPASRPEPQEMVGQHCRLEPLDAERHAALLFRAFAGEDSLWDYMSVGPFHSAAQFYRWVQEAVGDPSQQFYAIRMEARDEVAGLASYLRIKPDSGSIEVGSISYAPALQRTRAATEAMVLMMERAFALGYRRYEWKCNALNLASRRAAQRLGFSFEGVFRQALVVKGRNRDTAWFAVTDQDWPGLQAAYAGWLAPSNFDAQGRQIERLSDLTRLVRVSSDPAL